MNWGFRKDAEVVSKIADRAMKEGSTPLSEGECDATIRWAEEYKRRSDEKKKKEASKLRIIKDADKTD